jgi:hypothetical protein
LPNSITSFGNSCFFDCREITELALPTNLKSIGATCFQGCIKLKTINIPTGVTKLHDNTFAGCFKLESVTIPEGIASIGNGCFAACHALEEITLPSTIKYLGHSSFELEDGHTSSFTCKATTIPECGELHGEHSVYKAFTEYLQQISVLYVPAESLDAYKADPLWGRWSKLDDEGNEVGILPIK